MSRSARPAWPWWCYGCSVDADAAGRIDVRFGVTACVLVHRDDRWLLLVRSRSVAYAPGSLGLPGGHVEPVDLGAGVLESAARREVAEEAGLDLSSVELTYLESESFQATPDELQVTVTFTAPAPRGTEPRVAARAEVDAVGWWTADAARADPRCPSWLPALLERAARAVLAGPPAPAPHGPSEAGWLS